MYSSYHLYPNNPCVIIMLHKTFLVVLSINKNSILILNTTLNNEHKYLFSNTCDKFI